ncbi:MAG: SRPBCC domain-containing protein [Proteobacteria bacterium]|nr:SRPBCC domain-containing protein [Pseudomonadota bacterium]MDA0995013.1 SRPBCC domain-containing protein [Pseudomonadota bacterium]
MPTVPDLSSRPYQLTVEHTLTLAAGVVFRALTEQFDRWFAEPDTLLMTAEVDVPFFFETRFDGQRHPHYGRFLRLVPDELVEMTWVTGNPGTKGAETVVTIELSPLGTGTHIRLTHAGLIDEESRDGHEDAWPLVLDHLEHSMSRHV